MDDREMLEWAAKAAGYEVLANKQAVRDSIGLGHAGLWVKGVSTCWSPRRNDGDSRRLQVACRLALVPFPDAMVAMHNESGRSWSERHDAHGGDSCAAARVAIFRAAAEIGKSMP